MTKRPPIGIMQGRLGPKYQGRYQAHPVDYWSEEFDLAAEIGLDCIEFILDYEGATENPLLTESGNDQLKEIQRTTGVAVYSVCADYFMEAPLHSLEVDEVEKSQGVLELLQLRCRELNIGQIVIPCVDNSSLNVSGSITRFIGAIKPAVSLAERIGINLALETDLAPRPFCALLDRLESPNIKVNYDTGNSAYLGYNPDEEWNAYGDRISDVHVKDRRFGGKSVILGSGDAEFGKIFCHISEMG